MSEIGYDQLKSQFISTQERLDCYISILPEKNKKKKAILALAVSTGASQTVKLYVVKAGKGETKKKLLCEVSALAGMDCHDAPGRPSFDMELLLRDGSSRRLFAVRVEDKLRLVRRLVRLVAIYEATLLTRLALRNLPPDGRSVEELLREEDDNQHEHDFSVSQLHESDGEEQDYLDATDFNRYQNLSTVEEETLQRFLADRPDAVMNAVEFQATLRSHTLAMEGTNVHSIMASERQLGRLMEALDTAIEEVDVLESKVDMHDQFLAEVESSMSCLRDRDELLRMTAGNRGLLQASLASLLERISLESEHISALRSLDVGDPGSLERAQAAADKLQWLLLSPPQPGLDMLQAARERRERLEGCADELAQRLAAGFNGVLARQRQQLLATVPSNPERVLTEHRRCRVELAGQAALMGWLRAVRPAMWAKLQQMYLDKMASVYEHEIKGLVDALRHRLQAVRDKIASSQSGGSHSSLHSNASGSGSSKSKLLKLPHLSSVTHGSSSHSGGSLNHSESSACLPNDPVRLAIADKVEILFEEFLSKLKPIVLEEEQFMAQFFQVDCRRQSERQSAGDAHQSGSPSTEGLGLLVECSNVVFAQLATQLRALIGALEQQDASQSLLMVVVVNRQFHESVRASEFLQVTWGVLFLHTKRSFNAYIDRFCAGFRELKPSRKSRYGVLPFVYSYASFAEQTAKAFQDSNRQNDLINAHLKIVRELMTQVERIALDSQKIPREIIIMENYHRMKDILRRLKMPELDELQSELKTKYSDALECYVDSCVGRPFEKLYTFFENVEEALSRGLRPEEIGYQFAFSRAELARVLREYPGKEVKKGLEALCRKLERHMDGGGNSGGGSGSKDLLFPEVWVRVQSQFIGAVTRYRALIQRCYPGVSGLGLEFSLEELEKYFQEIAAGR